jgi:hypothetical protein
MVVLDISNLVAMDQMLLVLVEVVLGQQEATVAVVLLVLVAMELHHLSLDHL